MTSIYRNLLATLQIVLCSAAIGAETDNSLNPRHDATGALIRPESYRDWIFVGSSLGLRYDSEVKETRPAPEKELDFKNVYIDCHRQ